MLRARTCQAIRSAGMHASKTAIILPIFTQWRLKEVADCWRRRRNETKFDNIAFDLHWYHDFHSVNSY